VPRGNAGAAPRPSRPRAPGGRRARRQETTRRRAPGNVAPPALRNWAGGTSLSAPPVRDQRRRADLVQPRQRFVPRDRQHLRGCVSQRRPLGPAQPQRSAHVGMGGVPVGGDQQPREIQAGGVTSPRFSSKRSSFVPREGRGARPATTRRCTRARASAPRPGCPMASSCAIIPPMEIPKHVRAGYAPGGGDHGGGVVPPALRSCGRAESLSRPRAARAQVCRRSARGSRGRAWVGRRSQPRDEKPRPLIKSSGGFAGSTDRLVMDLRGPRSTSGMHSAREASRGAGQLGENRARRPRRREGPLLSFPS